MLGFTRSEHAGFSPGWVKVSNLPITGPVLKVFLLSRKEGKRSSNLYQSMFTSLANQYFLLK